MQLLDLPIESDRFVWPIAIRGHNTGRTPAGIAHPRGKMLWPRPPHASGLSGDRKDTFISSLAHELRQPLSVLRTTVDLLRRVTDRAAANAAADVMSRQIGRMSRLIEDVLEQTRWSRGTLALRKERLDARAVVNEAVSDVRGGAETLGLDLVVDESLEALWIDADSHRIRQVLSNVLGNAVKFTRAGGRISVTVAREAAEVSVRIADTGCGIAPDALPHIFDLFSQVCPTDAEGLGIGLSIVKEIVSLHGGRIEARSQGLGHGSEFVVTLPLA
jgi:signal transduction histidine kinase